MYRKLIFLKLYGSQFNPAVFRPAFICVIRGNGHGFSTSDGQQPVVFTPILMPESMEALRHRWQSTPPPRVRLLSVFFGDVNIGKSAKARIPVGRWHIRPAQMAADTREIQRVSARGKGGYDWKSGKEFPLVFGGMTQACTGRWRSLWTMAGRVWHRHAKS